MTQLLILKSILPEFSTCIGRFSTTTETTRRFNFSQIRNEILQNWLTATAKSNVGQQQLRAQYCCFTYQDGARAYRNKHAKWYWLDKELSSNIAGETGAVYIYKGALAAMSLRSVDLFTDDARDFVKEHMENERAHLSLFQAVVPTDKHTRMLPFWRAAGWTLGFVPTFLGGCDALYVTVEAVESFVEEHYQRQIRSLKDGGESTELVRLLEHCCSDEVHHKEDAAQKLLESGKDKTFDRWWRYPLSNLVQKGSAIAAEIARRI